MKKLLLSLLLLCSCSSRHLSVSMSYSTPKTLASIQVGTPDPAKCCPPIGQHLTVHWNIGNEFSCSDSWFILLTIRYKDATEEQFQVPVTRRSGESTYSLLNQKYVMTGGIATYRIDLYGDEEWKGALCHQLWSELIVFDDGEVGSCEWEYAD